jgi:phosphate transport system protein
MRIRLQNDIERLNKSVLSLGTLVEERFRMAVKAIERRDVELANRVIEGDAEIDQREVDLEEDCLKILALHQPVADQLRYIVAVLKLNNDLERIGDLAVNIAQSVHVIEQYSDIRIPFDYFAMAERTQLMMEQSLDSFVNKDLDLALKVCAQDDEVDSMKRELQSQFTKEVCRNTSRMEAQIVLFLVSRHLERIADHATNIAEDVIYMISGAIHRHRGSHFE